MNLQQLFNVRPVTEDDLGQAWRYDKNYARAFWLGYADAHGGKARPLVSKWLVGFNDGYIDGWNRYASKSRVKS